jgi:hypothetical protein
MEEFLSKALEIFPIEIFLKFVLNEEEEVYLMTCTMLKFNDDYLIDEKSINTEINKHLKYKNIWNSVESCIAWEHKKDLENFLEQLSTICDLDDKRRFGIDGLDFVGYKKVNTEKELKDFMNQLINIKPPTSLKSFKDFYQD